MFHVTPNIWTIQYDIKNFTSNKYVLNGQINVLTLILNRMENMQLVHLPKNKSYL